MPPRVPFIGALRQSASFLTSQCAKLSTTTPARALRQPPPASRPAPPSTSASTLLEMDEAAPKSASAQTSTNAASNMYSILREQRQAHNGGPEAEDTLAKFQEAEAHTRMLKRKWMAGNVYAAQDLGSHEMNKWQEHSKNNGPDFIHALGLKPLDLYRNPAVISQHVSKQGRIRDRRLTGLNRVNHRKMAKAIRRAIGQGLHPSIHHHPELLLRASARYRPGPGPATPAASQGSFM